VKDVKDLMQRLIDVWAESIIQAASKQAYLFVNKKWQATKKAIGSTMLAAHSKHNSKKISSHPKKNIYILATPHNHNITLINTKEQQ